MRVGLVNRCNIETALDRAWTLQRAGVSVVLYLFQAKVALLVNDSEHPLERLHEYGLIPPGCQVRLFKFPRMRDPRSFGVVRRMAQAMQADNIDAAHILMGPGEIWLAVLALLLRRRPVVSTLIVPVPNVGADLPPFVEVLVHRLLILGSTMLIVNGAGQIAQVEEHFRVPVSRIVHVPLGSRTTAVQWSNNGASEVPGTVLFFGRATPHKGLEYLVRAQPIITRRVPAARIHIASRGEYLNTCKQLITDPSRFQIYEGFIPGTQAAELFSQASVVALPYVTASTSGVLLDAYSFGKPVVASRVGCLPEYVQEGVTGLLVAPGKVEALADAIVNLLEDDALRHRMGQNAHDWLAAQDRAIAARLIATYEKALSFHHRR